MFGKFVSECEVIHTVMFLHLKTTNQELVFMLRMMNVIFLMQNLEGNRVLVVIGHLLQILNRISDVDHVYLLFICLCLNVCVCV